MIPGCLGRPTIDGKTARGASSPAKPALHIPDPLSTTRAWTSSSSSHIFIKYISVFLFFLFPVTFSEVERSSLWFQVTFYYFVLLGCGFCQFEFENQ